MKIVSKCKFSFSLQNDNSVPKALFSFLFTASSKKKSILGTCFSLIFFPYLASLIDLISPIAIAIGLLFPTFFRLLKNLIPQNDFKALNLKFFVCVTNITDGEEWILDQGNLHQAVAASCAIPILFEPIKIEEKVCVDGGLLNNMPIQPLKNLGLPIIGVNINEHGKAEDLNSIPQIAKRAFNLAVWKATQANWEKCDVKIDVTGVHDFGLLDFHKGNELFEIGYNSAMKCEKELKALLKQG